MNTDGKIEILQATKAGKQIQVKNKACEIPSMERYGWGNHPDWEDLIIVGENTFNFGLYNYRIKQRDLIAIAAEYGFDIDRVRAIASAAKVQHEIGRVFKDKWSNGDDEPLIVTYQANGDTQVGCQFFTWEEIDSLGKEQGWWS